MSFSKHYNHKQEEKIYKFWNDNKYFSPEKVNSDSKETFYIPMPPPNVTGVLHLWHAQTLSIEDAMTRYARMKGKKTLFIPGTDHAGISTQVVVEKKLKAEENKTRHELGRTQFLDKVWDWVKFSRSTILDQVKTMGASCDWDREQFTLSEKMSRAVRKVFKDLYENDKIYKDSYIVNWCPRCQTVLSDIEVNHDEEEGKLVYIKYFIVGKGDSITIATTRPETMFADVAVAVNPQDKRYKKYIGKQVHIPIINKKIPVIWDYDVERTFGTGALKITPNHDPADFHIAHRHKLPMDCFAIDKEGKLTDLAGKFAGIDSAQAVDPILSYLDDIGNIDKIEPYEHKVPKCERCNTVVQPMVSSQWFVDVEEAAKKNVDAVKNGDMKFIPSRFENTFFRWMENIRPWCISRQLRWGHRIPVWYCEKWHKNVLNEEDILYYYKSNEGKKSLGNVFLDMMIFNLIADSRLEETFNVEQLIDTLYSDSLTSQIWTVWQAYISSYEINIKDWDINDSYLIEQLASIKDILSSIFGQDVDKITESWEKLAEYLEESNFTITNDDTYKFKLECKECGSQKMTQEEDVLDTWFSSALWPFTTLGWPENTEDLKNFYPNDILETGYDIIFFWIVRMIIMWYYNMGWLDDKPNWKPFDNIYLHGLVRDENGVKMSKSIWNVVDPLTIIEDYGTDALRLTLILGNTPGNDLKFSKNKVDYNRRFLDKIWNASRYVYGKLWLENEDTHINYDALWELLRNNQDKLNDFDMWIMTQLDDLIEEMEKGMTSFHFWESTSNIQKFVWNKFCDWYLEITKQEKSDFTDTVLLYSIGTIMKLLHPIIPFITEDIWHTFKFDGALIVSSFPKSLWFKEKGKIELFVNAIIALRALKQWANIKPHQHIDIYISPDSVFQDVIEKYENLIKYLLKWDNLLTEEVNNMDFSMIEWVKVWIRLVDSNVDYRIKLEELNKQLKDEEQFLNGVRKLLSSPGFVEKAKPEVIAKKKEKKKEVEDKMLKIQEEISKIKMRIN